MKKILSLSILINALLLVTLVFAGQAYFESQDLIESLQTEDSASTLVFFTPAASFTDAEKQRLQERVIDPYQAYGVCIGAADVVAVEVVEANTPGYLYAFSMFAEDGSHHSFLFGEAGLELPYYTPDLLLTECVDVLPHADEIRDQAVDEYRG